MKQFKSDYSHCEKCTKHCKIKIEKYNHPYQKNAFLAWKKSNIGIIQIPAGGGKTK